MNRSKPVTYDEIVRAAIGRLRRGENLSVDAIRRDLGDRGSKTTITKYLNEWRSTLNEQALEVLPPNLPESLVQPFETLWNEAVRIAELTLAKHREALDTELVRATKAREAAEEQALSFHQFAKEKEHEAETVRAALERTESHLTDAQTQIEQQRHAIQSLNDRIEARDNEIRIQRDSYEQRIRSLNDDLVRDREALLQRIKITEDNARAEAQKSEKQLDYWILEVDKERTRSKEQSEKDERRIKRLDDELLIARKKIDAMSMRLSETERSLMAAQDAAESLQNSVKKLTSDLEEARRMASQRAQESELTIERQQEIIKELRTQIDAQNAGTAEDS